MAELLRKHGYTRYNAGISLGEGAYSKVKSAYSKKLKRDVAVKIISRKVVSSEFLENFLPRELEILPSLNHPCVVKILDILGKGEKVFIVMELVAGGDLQKFISVRGALTEVFSRELFRQLSQAIRYLHDMDVVHRDLKCENLLLDEDYHLKVCDFGFSRRLSYEAGQLVLSKTYCGSRAYAAPEVLQGIPYDPRASDVWSMGVVLYVMLCDRMPYDDSNLMKMVKLQKEHRVDFPNTATFPSGAKDLIHQTLHPAVSQRMKTHDITEHSWMQTGSKTQDGRRDQEDRPSTSGTRLEMGGKAEGECPRGQGQEIQEGSEAESHPKLVEGGAGNTQEDNVTC